MMTAPTEAPLCPGDRAGDCETALGAPASVVAALSSFPSLLVSAVAVYVHLRSLDAAPASRSVITYMATANMLASLGYFMGAMNYQAHQEAAAYTFECNARFLPVCQVQSFLTCAGVMMSLFWTSVLAVQLYQSVVKGRVYLERRVMLACHLVGWGLPTLLSFGLLAGGELGYSTVTASSWCFVADANAESLAPKPIWKIALLVFAGGMFFELCMYVIVMVCVVLAACHREQPSSPHHNAKHLSDKHLLMVPMMVLILRSWGVVYTLSSLVNVDTVNIIKCVDLNDTLRSLFSILGILQAIGDPAAVGWGTILLYFARSPSVRGQLWNDVARCLTCCGLRTRFMYRGSRPSKGTYMYKDSVRVPTVIYAKPRTASGNPPPATGPMRNAGRFLGGAEPSSTGYVSQSH